MLKEMDSYQGCAARIGLRLGLGSHLRSLQKGERKLKWEAVT